MGAEDDAGETTVEIRQNYIAYQSMQPIFGGQ